MDIWNVLPLKNLCLHNLFAFLSFISLLISRAITTTHMFIRNKSNLLGVAYASVDEGKISGLSLCVVPTPDSAERSGIYPGL